MLEDVGPDLAKALVTGLLAGGASVAVQLLSPRVAKVLGRLRPDRAGEMAHGRRLERRLAAIVAGYARLMTADEEGTHFRPSARGHRAQGPRASRPDRQTYR
jgi:hypothetical protein